MSDKYILDNRKVVPEPDLLAWGEWFETADRRVAVFKNQEWKVSTVFLGLGHRFDDGPPLLFETIVFSLGDWTEVDSDRYSTWDEAEAGHKRMVERWSSRTTAPSPNPETEG